MTKVLVNAVSIKEGGPLVVLSKLLPAMQRASADFEFIAAVNPRITEVDGSYIDRINVPVDQSMAHLFYWYEVTLPALLRQRRIDVLLSITNYLPRRSIRCPSFLLEQHAGHFSDEFDRLTREASPSWSSQLMWSQKGNWVRRSIEKATAVTVQTSALADAIKSSTNVKPENIHVIRHGPGWVQRLSSPRVGRTRDCWRLGYVTKWGVQKDFRTLFEALRILDRAGWPISLILTLDPSYGPAAKTLALAREMGIEGLIDNRGDVPPHEIMAVYDSLDIFAFLSTCESFGIPMAEAMARGLPIIVSETKTNLEITGNAALTFPPHNAGELAARLIGLMSDPSEWSLRSSASLDRSQDFSWEAAAQQMIAVLNNLNENAGGPVHSDVSEIGRLRQGGRVCYGS